MDLKEDVIVAISMSPNGDIKFIIPPNLMMATYLLKVLEINISRQINMNLTVNQKPTIIQAVKNKVVKIFKK